jgi:hypothetical protein
LADLRLGLLILSRKSSIISQSCSPKYGSQNSSVASSPREAPEPCIIDHDSRITGAIKTLLEQNAQYRAELATCKNDIQDLKSHNELLANQNALLQQQVQILTQLWQQSQNANRTGRTTIEKVVVVGATVVGGGAGAVAGVAGGAEIGFAIGVAVGGPPGAAAGAALGLLIGGITGAVAGAKSGKAISNFSIDKIKGNK